MKTNVALKKRFAAALAVLSACVLLFVGTGCFVALEGPVFVIEDMASYECYFDSSGGREVINVVSDCTYWEFDDPGQSNDKWISVYRDGGNALVVRVKPSDKPHSQKIRLRAMKQEDGVTLAEATLTVRQLDGACPLTLSSYEGTFPQAGGRVVVLVNSATGWRMENTTEDRGWFTVTRTDHSFMVNVKENETGESRTGELVFSNKDDAKTFRFTQE
ncbi:MAG: BACON domain-containing protein [Clostridia bacterium]|nr:BACON domain-containing protein [Clostridia bacterium]